MVRQQHLVSFRIVIRERISSLFTRSRVCVFEPRLARSRVASPRSESSRPAVRTPRRATRTRLARDSPTARAFASLERDRTRDERHRVSEQRDETVRREIERQRRRRRDERGRGAERRRAVVAHDKGAAREFTRCSGVGAESLKGARRRDATRRARDAFQLQFPRETRDARRETRTDERRERTTD